MLPLLPLLMPLLPLLTETTKTSPLQQCNNHVSSRTSESVHRHVCLCYFSCQQQWDQDSDLHLKSKTHVSWELGSLGEPNLLPNLQCQGSPGNVVFSLLSHMVKKGPCLWGPQASLRRRSCWLSVVAWQGVIFFNDVSTLQWHLCSSKHTLIHAHASNLNQPWWGIKKEKTWKERRLKGRKRDFPGIEGRRGRRWSDTIYTDKNLSKNKRQI